MLRPYEHESVGWYDTKPRQGRRKATARIVVVAGEAYKL